VFCCVFPDFVWINGLQAKCVLLRRLLRISSKRIVGEMRLVSLFIDFLLDENEL